MLEAAYRFKNADRGATAIEYGVIAAGVALAIAGAVAVMGDNLAGTFGWLSEQLDSAATDGTADTDSPAIDDTADTNVDDPTSGQPEPQTINRDRGGIVIIPRR